VLQIEGYVFQSEFAKRNQAVGEARGRAEGEARGRAESLLRILDRHDIKVTDDARQRITDCTELATLDSWIDRALDAQTIEDVLD
jgi:hypothetical protein